jgi:hypothetical protein
MIGAIATGRSWVTLGATLCALASAANPALASGPDGAAIVRGAGRVRPEGAHEWRDMSTADVLTSGVSVQAAADQPLEMNLPDGVTVTLEPSALAKWMPAGKLPSEINRWTRGYHLVLEEGELEVRMPTSAKGAHAFLVSTKAGTLTDWRGQLHVRVHGDSAAAAIYEGALVVGSNGQGFPVYDGAGILMQRGVNPDKTRGIPGTPQWEARSGGFLMQSADARGPINLAWQPASNAASYRVEIATDASLVRVVERSATADLRYTTTLPAAAGRYWAHVRAVGPEGIVGAWSTPQLIRVLRYRLPEGAVIARDGAIVLPDGTSLAFPESEGLEVAFENVSLSDPAAATRAGRGAYGSELGTSVARHVEPTLYWSPLGTSVRLSDYAPMRIVHLRDPVSGSETRLLLARRQLHADVELSPSNARWPRDPIDARIRVYDPSGRMDVSSEPISVEAALDLTPLGVSWHHEGNTWTGRIAPKAIGAPSIVRVVVKDSHSGEIGRGFVELEPEQIPSAHQ